LVFECILDSRIDYYGKEDAVMLVRQLYLLSNVLAFDGVLTLEYDEDATGSDPFLYNLWVSSAA